MVHSVLKMESQWPTVQWGYQDQRRVVFKGLKNAKRPYEEKALSYLNQPSLRNHPDNLTVGKLSFLRGAENDKISDALF